MCPNIFAENLTKIFNRTIEKCEYPVQMKMAKVIALYKKGKRYQANNYLPISLLSILNKLLEKLLSRRMMKFLNANDILFNFQYGFHKLHSTTLALIEFTGSARRFLDNGNYVISIFVDLTRAFDTVDHEILYTCINLTDMAFAAMPMISLEHILQIDFNIRLSMVLNRCWMLSHVEYLRVLF